MGVGLIARYSMLHAWLPSKMRPDKAHITFCVENIGKSAPVRRSFQAAWFYYQSAKWLRSAALSRAGLNYLAQIWPLKPSQSIKFSWMSMPSPTPLACACMVVHPNRHHDHILVKNSCLQPWKVFTCHLLVSDGFNNNFIFSLNLQLYPNTRSCLSLHRASRFLALQAVHQCH